MDTAIEALPNQPAVFLLWPADGEPFLSRTGLLRRRLLRLLKEREKPSRLLNLRHTVARIEYRLTGSAFESSIAFYEEARKHFPERYLQLMKLRMPPYLKVVLGEQFPRRPHHNSSDAQRGTLFRTVPFARVRGAVRRRVPRSVSDAALPGGFDPDSQPSGLHLRGDGDVPAPLPAGGGTRGVRSRSGARGGNSCGRTGAACWRRSAIRATA